jgi:threonine dehydratase
LLKELNANIVHISYDRTAISLDYGDANVTVHMETKGEEHQANIRKVLKEEGYLRD